MPCAHITRDSTLISNDTCGQLAPIIRQLIAQCLSVPGDEAATLALNEIEVRFHEVGPFDVNTSPLAIEIFANDSPGRRSLVDAGAAGVIAAGIKAVFHETVNFGDDSFVWIFLGYGGFARIPKS